MGIRVECPNGHRLNVKSHLAGKRGVCPECQVKFTIPELPEEAAQSTDHLATATAVTSALPTPAAPDPPTGSPQPPSLAPPALPPTAATLPDVWYLRASNGEQFGPANTETFTGWAAAGRVPADSLVWRTGWPEWKSGQAALAELEVPLIPPGEISSTPVLEEDLTTEPLPADLYRMRQRRRRDRAKLFTLLMSAVVFILLVVLVVILVRD